MSFLFAGKTDPYVVFLLGEQTFRSKKNSKTSLIGPPGAPVWNQVILGHFFFFFFVVHSPYASLRLFTLSI